MAVYPMRFRPIEANLHVSTSTADGPLLALCEGRELRPESWFERVRRKHKVGRYFLGGRVEIRGLLSLALLAIFAKLWRRIEGFSR